MERITEEDIGRRSSGGSKPPLVHIQIGGREYDGGVDIRRCFRVREVNIPAFEKGLNQLIEQFQEPGEAR